jgi:hypothetical protein
MQNLANPLHSAVVSQDWDKIECLLAKGPCAHTLDKFGNTPLIQAALTSGWTISAMGKLWNLLKKDPTTDIYVANKVPFNLLLKLLFYILKEEQLSKVQILLLLTYHQYKQAGLTLIHALAWRGWAEVLDEILPHNPNTCTDGEKERLRSLVNTPMSDGTTPLMFAVFRGHAATAQLLISRGSVTQKENKVNLLWS